MHSSSRVKLKFDRANLCMCVGDRRKIEVIDFWLSVKAFALLTLNFYSWNLKVQRMNWINNKLFLCIYVPTPHTCVLCSMNPHYCFNFVGWELLKVIGYMNSVEHFIVCRISLLLLALRVITNSSLKQHYLNKLWF